MANQDRKFCPVRIILRLVIDSLCGQFKFYIHINSFLNKLSFNKIMQPLHIPLVPITVNSQSKSTSPRRVSGGGSKSTRSSR